MNYTDITILLDRSGSMTDIRSDVVGGINEFVKTQTNNGADARVTLIQFDTTDPFEIVRSEVPAKDFSPLVDADFVPRGGTPLLDSLGKAIAATGERLKQKPESERPAGVVFVILTDGRENSSVEYTTEMIRKAVKHQAEAYQWQFVYLGANQDAFAEARKYGIPAANAANYGPGGQSVRAATCSVASNVNKYAAATVKCSVDVAFSDKDRKNMA